MCEPEQCQQDIDSLTQQVSIRAFHTAKHLFLDQVPATPAQLLQALAVNPPHLRGLPGGGAGAAAAGQAQAGQDQGGWTATQLLFNDNLS